MRRTFLRRAIVLLCLSVLLRATTLRAQTKEEPAPPKTLEELQRDIKSELDKNHVPGGRRGGHFAGRTPLVRRNRRRGRRFQTPGHL
jgi:hypothetical protein